MPLSLSQRSMVAASLGATHHPDVYSVRRILVPEANAEPAIHVESLSESTPATPHKPGSDGRGSGSSRPDGPTPCPHCTRGTTTGPNGEVWRCHFCGGSGVTPVQPPRIVPGTTRTA